MGGNSFSFVNRCIVLKDHNYFVCQIRPFSNVIIQTASQAGSHRSESLFIYFFASSAISSIFDFLTFMTIRWVFWMFPGVLASESYQNAVGPQCLYSPSKLVKLSFYGSNQRSRVRIILFPTIRGFPQFFFHQEESSYKHPRFL